MTWHYRAVKRDGQFYVTEYYPKLESWVEEPIVPQGDTKLELIKDLDQMIKDIKATSILEEKE